MASRRTLLRAILPAIGGTLFGGIGGTAFFDWRTDARGERRLAAERTAKRWARILDIGPTPTYLLGDDFSLYPTSNPWSRAGLQTDPRARDVASSLAKFVGQFDYTVDAQTWPFDSLGSQRTFLKPTALGIFGSTIINRASRVMLGEPIQDHCLHQFFSLDRRWHADLKVGQYTPRGGPVVHSYNSIADRWDYWDHQLCVGKERFSSSFESKDKHPATQLDCYFHITKLTSPSDLWPQQTILMPTPLHTFGATALAQVFEFPLDDAALEFVSSLIDKVATYPSWQVAARASDFQFKAGSLKANKIELLRFFPIDTKLT